MLETCDLYDFGIYKPQLVHKNYMSNPGELSYKKGWLVQEKIDGYFEYLVKENDNVYMFARNKSKKDGFYTQKIEHVPHLKEWAIEELPNGTCLIGEIYVPGGTSKSVTTILGCKEDKAVNRQKESGQYLNYYIHDMIKYDGHDYVENEDTFSRRFSDLCKYIDLGCDLPQEIQVAPVADTLYVDVEDLINTTFEENKEGLVFKLENGIYRPGKRHKDMFKIKQDAGDMDFVITGFVDPVKEYTGKELDTWPYWVEIEVPGRVAPLRTPVTKAYFNNWKQGFTIGLYDSDHVQEIGKVTSGLTDAMREDIAKNPDKYLGKVIKVGAMSVDKKEHSLRHPVFMDMHESKDAGDCHLEDVFS